MSIKKLLTKSPDPPRRNQGSGFRVRVLPYPIFSDKPEDRICGHTTAKSRFRGLGSRFRALRFRVSALVTRAPSNWLSRFLLSDTVYRTC